MRSVYKLTNSTISLPFLSAAFLRALFINLADESLAFLAGIWVGELGPASEELSISYRRAAIAHASAFFKAHEFTDHVIDFQTILPALLVALQDADIRIRKSACECVQILGNISKATKANGVYGFDTVYGKASSK